MSTPDGFKPIPKSVSPETDLGSPERNDVKVMEEIGGKYYMDVVNYCTRQLREHGSQNPADEALDFAQITMMQAWKHVKEIDPQQNIRGWLFKIAKNMMINASVKGKRDLLKSAESLSSTGPGDDERTLEDKIQGEDLRDTNFTREEIERVLTHLDPENAEIIQLETIKGLNTSEIAKRLHIPTSEVKSRRERAQIQLEDRLLN